MTHCHVVNTALKQRTNETPNYILSKRDSAEVLFDAYMYTAAGLKMTTKCISPWNWLVIAGEHEAKVYLVECEKDIDYCKDHLDEIPSPV